MRLFSAPEIFIPFGTKETGTENRRQKKMKSIYGAAFWSVFHEAEDCLSVCLSVYLSVAVCRSEINLGVGATGFTLVKYYRPSADKNSFIRVCLSVCLFICRYLSLRTSNKRPRRLLMSVVPMFPVYVNFTLRVLILSVYIYLVS